jgi:LuxR family transcriptional regulator, maltose regulon positive regulatory protein
MNGLVSTKLGPQARGAHAISRSRLSEMLDTTADARLVLLSAPAGFGKSTLLADWLAASGLAWGWLSLDAGDNDPARFWRYLLAAVGSIDGAGRPVGSDGPRTDGEGAVREMLDRLAACPSPCVLVLDDYHLIEEPSVHEHLAFALAHLPPQARLAIATRSDPPFALALLRSRGELLEIRAADLRFTADEAIEWLRGGLGLPLATEEIAQLAERTEGWAAALQLAALSLRGRPDAGDLVRQFGASHRFILDYVVEEVLAGLAPASQEFLLRTSILDRLCGPLCDAVTGETGGQERLEEFERANLLIGALDDERHWFRYHALFAEVLRARLQTAHPELVLHLHERASAWLEERGDIDAAIRHGLLIPTLERVRRLLRDHWLERLMQGEIRTVRGWLDSLPDALVRSDPQLSTAYGWCLLLAGESTGVAQRIADGERAVGAVDIDPFDRTILPSQLASQRARLAEMEGDLDASVRHARVALGLISADVDPTYGARLRGQATIQLANVLRETGDLSTATTTYRAAVPLFAAGGNWLAVARSVCNVARLEIGSGNPGAALELCRSTAPQIPEGSSALAAILVAKAEALLALGDPDAAEIEATAGMDLARRGGDRPTLAEATEVLERISRARSGIRSGGVSSRASVSRAGPGLVERLTPRELEFLRLVCAGRSNSQIARELFVTVGTAKAHLHTIYGKLGAANRVEAILQAQGLGLAG